LRATWIWYPGDFEIWLNKVVSLRRKERGIIYPPYWRLDMHYPRVRFRKNVSLDQPETIQVYVDGIFSVTLNHKLLYGSCPEITIPSGVHTIEINVFSQENLPSIYITGKSIKTDASWEVSYDNKHWAQIGFWNFDSPAQKPSLYSLPTREIPPVSVEKRGETWLIDFGQEFFGFLRFCGIKGKGQVKVYYGESLAEALAPDLCETLDQLELIGDVFTSEESRAFRYVQLVPEGEIKWEEIVGLYEYLPLDKKGEFRCSDPLINRIWEVASYTLELNTREFFLDGIKRDRWVWGGDAYLCALMNYYLFFDLDVVKRTLVALRGKDPIEMHINHIMDYTFYWFLTIYDYYLYTGDLEFIRWIYPKARRLMDFCLKRCDDTTGFILNKPGDWVFIDWAELDNRGLVSTEQILFCQSLKALGDLANELGKSQEAEVLYCQAKQLKVNIFQLFWHDDLGGLIHNHFDEGVKQLTRYPNIFAMLFGYLTVEQRQQVKEQVLLNSQVQTINTPYMRSFELAALCENGEYELVLDEIRSYWGGMLYLGATTFWEHFDPEQHGEEHYATHRSPFGKSLCHAWGASPIYLLGKYFLGVRPVSPGYKRFIVEPKLGNLSWLEGVVPFQEGYVRVALSKNTLKVKTTAEGGILRFTSLTEPSGIEGRFELVASNTYEIPLIANKEYTIALSS